MPSTELEQICEKIGSGKEVITKIDRTEIDSAILVYEDGDWYICQNKKNGSNCQNKYGYKYSWYVDSNVEYIKLKYSKEELINMKKIILTIERERGNTYFAFKIDKELEKVYKDNCQEVRESSSWPGLKFYYLPEIIASPSYKNLLDNYGLFDDYGQKLISGRKLNIAWLRTVDGEGRIKVSEPMAIAELAELVKRTTTFIKEYFENYFRDCKIDGEVTIDI